MKVTRSNNFAQNIAQNVLANKFNVFFQKKSGCVQLQSNLFYNRNRKKSNAWNASNAFGVSYILMTGLLRISSIMEY